MSTEDRLRGFLNAKGDEIADSVDHESIQPEQRRRPSWLVAVAAAAAVLVVIGGVGLFARSGDGPVVDEAADTTTTAATVAAAAAGPTLAWTEVQGPDVGDGYVSAILTVDNGFIAFAESWNEATETPIQQAWHSTDGVAWTAVELAGMEGAQVFSRTITKGGPGFVAVGMEFDEPPGPYGPGTGTFLAWTSTSGLDWEAHTLPQPDLPEPDPLVTWYPSVETVAASDAGIVAAGTAHAEVMMEQIAAEYLGLSIDEAMETICGYGFGDGSLEVMACPENQEDGGYVEEELLFEATFEELGISEEAAQMMEGMSEEALVWYSPDGNSWELLDDPFGSPAYVTSVAATDTGFYAVSHGPMRPAVWYSADGRTWEATGATPEDGDIDRVFARDGVLYATGWQRQSAAALWSSTDGVAWTAIDLNALFAGEEGQHSIWELQTGGLGLIGQADSYVDPFIDAEPVVIEADGLEITVWLGEGERVRIVDPATGVVLLEGGPWEYREPEPFELERDGYRLAMDLEVTSATLTELATGEVVLEIDGSAGYGEPEGLRFDEEGGYIFYDPATDDVFLTVAWQEIDEILGLSPPYVRWDEDGIHYIDPATGEEIVTVPMEDYEQAMNEAYAASEEFYEEPKMALVFSPNGTAWSRQPVADAFGEAGWVESMTVGDDAVIVVFRPHGDNFPQNEADAELYEPPSAEFWLGTLDG